MGGYEALGEDRRIYLLLLVRKRVSIPRPARHGPEMLGNGEAVPEVWEDG